MQRDGQDARGDGEVRGRYLAFLDYLEELYRKQHPPVRDIASYQDLQLRETDGPLGRGIEVTPDSSAPAWLTATLVTAPPPPPELPVHLEDLVESPTIGPAQPPSVRRRQPLPLYGQVGEPDPDLSRAHAELDRWIEDVWRPWSETWHDIERGRGRYKALHRLRDRLAHDREAYELVWGFGRVRWRRAAQSPIDHPLL